MISQPKVYLADPGVFRPNAKDIAEELEMLCARKELEGLWPPDSEFSAGEHSSERDFAEAIYRRNVTLIRETAAVVADISPFRGPHMDVGTAFEIGAAVTLGLLVYLVYALIRPEKF